MNNRRAILSVVWLLLGLTLTVLAIAGKLDSFWSGMGGGLTAVGAVQLLRYYRLSKNEEYREKVEVEISDERNRFIRNKAWAWAGYLFVLIMAVGIIVLRLLGQDLLSQAAAYAVCLLLILYWGSYLVLRKKY